MSYNRETPHTATAHSTPASRKNSYSRKRWNAFDAWQDHVRKSAASVGVAFSERHDRDLRRAIITG
jgi:hypothetical protein